MRFRPLSRRGSASAWRGWSPLPYAAGVYKGKSSRWRASGGARVKESPGLHTPHAQGKRGQSPNGLRGAGSPEELKVRGSFLLPRGHATRLAPRAPGPRGMMPSRWYVVFFLVFPLPDTRGQNTGGLGRRMDCAGKRTAEQQVGDSISLVLSAARTETRSGLVTDPGSLGGERVVPGWLTHERAPNPGGGKS